jgi:integrase
VIPTERRQPPETLIVDGEAMPTKIIGGASEIRDDSAARARGAEIATKIGNHTFRATGVTASLKNGGTLDRAAQMANHASTRTTQLYDRRAEEVTLDEVERVAI